jgi:hypothetical protein
VYRFGAHKESAREHEFFLFDDGQGAETLFFNPNADAGSND